MSSEKPKLAGGATCVHVAVCFRGVTASIGLRRRSPVGTCSRMSCLITTQYSYCIRRAWLTSNLGALSQEYMHTMKSGNSTVRRQCLRIWKATKNGTNDFWLTKLIRKTVWKTSILSLLFSMLIHRYFLEGIDDCAQTSSNAIKAHFWYLSLFALLLNLLT